MTVQILVGDVREKLATLPDRSVRCCVTSPPYWGLRDYGVAGQLGLEATPAAYVAAMVEVFRDVRQVLTDDGTLWLNLGDSYSSMRDSKVSPDSLREGDGTAVHTGANNRNPAALRSAGLKHKDLVGIPWRVAFALQEDGWYLRSDIIWSKPNPMPESVTDRPTKAHEYVFLLSKSARYFYDADAIREEASWTRENNPAWQIQRAETNAKKGAGNRNAADGGFTQWDSSQGRNCRTVWAIATAPFKEAHFATFPPELPRRCILAGSAVGDTVLDPFGGAGTTGLVADRLGRNVVLIELNPLYAAMAERRIHNDAPLFEPTANALQEAP